MSKAARNGAKRPGKRKVVNGTAPAAPENSLGFGWANVYESAKRTGFEGYFWIPDLTPSEKMDSMTRRAIIERSDWLCDNCPPVGMAIDSLALDEVGTGLWPKWTTGQDDYDSAMTDAYHDTNHDPRVFSADGEQECYGVQYAIRRVIARYGDGFGQLLRPAPGSQMPSHALYSGYLVDNFGDEDPAAGWKDGRLANKAGRALKYRVLNKEHPDGYQNVDANDLIHYHDPFLPGQSRGLPALTPVCKKLFRMEDIEQAIADGTLSREMVGWAIENAKPDIKAGPAMTGARATDTITNADGSRFTVQKFFGDRNKNRVAVPELPAGASFKMFESNRPATAVMEFLDSILRQLAWARRYPPEYVFFLAGGQGTGWRLVLEKVKTQIGGAREFQLRPQFLNRWHVFTAWMRIRSGYFETLSPPVKVPANWWKHKIIYPRDMTVDPERVLRIYAELASKNQFSIDALHGMSGEDASDVEDANLKRIEKRSEKLAAMNKRLGTNFTYFEVWPPSTNAPTNNDSGAAAAAVSDL